MLVAGAVVLVGIGAVNFWRLAGERPVDPEAPRGMMSPGQNPAPGSPDASDRQSGQPKDSKSPAQNLSGNGQRFNTILHSGDALINKAMEEILPLWVAENPLEALRYTESLPAGPLRDSIRHKMLQCWAERAPGAAWAWVDTRPPEEKPSLSLAICKQVAGTDPGAAVLLAQNRGLAKENPDFLAYLLGQWAEANPAPALAWARSQSDQEARNRLLTQVALARTAKSRYQEAIFLVLDEIPEAAAQDDAIAAIVNRWAQKDLKAATRWVDDNFSLEDPLRGRAFSELEAARRGQLALKSLK